MTYLTRIDPREIAVLLPLSLVVSAEGEILSAGPTLRRIIGKLRYFDEVFVIERPGSGIGGAGLPDLLKSGKRFFLSLRAHRETTLRGHGIPLDDGAGLINLGFGVGLPEAVRRFGLTDADFAPSDLAMELLFLHEANAAVQAELAAFSHELEDARNHAEAQAYTDPLTGLYNRRGLDVALNAALREAATQPFALAHIDLDFFKEVNDRHGHAAGDAVLVEVGRILREELRSGDTAARIGGDEFVLVLASSVEDEHLLKIAERIIARIEGGMEFGGQTLSVSGSIGLTASGDYFAPQARQMLADADAALYQAKHFGKGRAQLFRR